MSKISYKAKIKSTKLVEYMENKQQEQTNKGKEQDKTTSYDVKTLYDEFEQKKLEDLKRAGLKPAVKLSSVTTLSIDENEDIEKKDTVHGEKYNFPLKEPEGHILMASPYLAELVLRAMYEGKSSKVEITKTGSEKDTRYTVKAV